MAELPAAITTRGYWKSPTDPAQQGRRSIYVFVKRNLRYPLFEAFDFPDTHEPCARRQVTTTAPQALLLLNDETTLKLARSFAARIVRETGADPGAQIERAYLLAFGRPPQYDEKRAALAFLQRQSKLLAATSSADPAKIAGTAAASTDVHSRESHKPGAEPPKNVALTDFCHALFNANEFCYVE
jgi:hypothetical protein